MSLQATSAGTGDLAVGNVVGSNIANTLLILGLSATITPLVVHSQLVRVDVPLMIAASLRTWLLACDGRIGRLDGAILFGVLLAYLGWSLRQARRESQRVRTSNLVP